MAFDRVMRFGEYDQIFRVPTEPLSALIQRPGEGWLIRRQTIEAANIALWKIGQYNQFVQQQTDFNTRNIAEFFDGNLSYVRRRALADAAFRISLIIHRDVIGDATWYQTLTNELEANINDLENRRQGWWTKLDKPLRWCLLISSLALAVGVAALILAAIK